MASSRAISGIRRLIGKLAGTNAGKSPAAPRNQSSAYDATRDTHRRKAPTVNLKSEDAALCKRARKRMTSGSRDLRRNFPDAAWAIRKHLDFTSSYHFQARTGDPVLDAAIEEWVRVRSLPHNCDLAGRHPLHRFLRITEACRTVDGDVFLLKLGDGRMQGIEGDRVRVEGDLPKPYKAEQFTHGIRTSRGGRALEYCVCRRIKDTGRFEFDRIFPAKFILPHGYYDRFDQVRGVTPLSTALNSFRDLYEGRAYALAKIKVAQLFGLVITRDNADPLGDIAPPPIADGETETDEEAEERDYASEINFAMGPQVLDMDRGDTAEFLENKTPSMEYQNFDRLIIASALKSLDIPYSFYDESHTNFFGSKGALQQYLFSANIKRADVRALLDAWTRWQLGMAVAAGDLILPASMDFAALKWQWIPTGLPWWKPLEEVKADIEAIAHGLTSTSRACLQRGEDAYEILAEQIKYETTKAALLAESGVTWPGSTPAAPDAPGALTTALQKEMTGELAHV